MPISGLPASHIIEMIFLTPEGFDGGGVDNILRIAMKSSEQDAGSPLIGILFGALHGDAQDVV
ncbi:hypothetical protein EN779_15135, partial [Mesorhizobium sp. M4B.F.Ca.ET.088.02.2.1]